MFSSKSKEKETPQPAPQAPTLAQQKKPAIRASAGPSVISADLIVNGSLTSAGDIQVDGRVEGDVRSAGLIVGDKAVIHGEVYAEDLTVRGRIEGGIHARKVLLCSTCHVEGNILHNAFAVETGAFFEGNCRHADDPLSEPPARRQSADYASRPAVGTAQPLNTGAPFNTPSATPGIAVARPLDASAARPATPKP